MRRKLRSTGGSSILFALLLLLVCAAVGSVVLTAGTAAAGRMSKTAEADRRFYAVQSAARLFKEQMDGQSVEIIRTKTTTTQSRKTSYTKDSDGSTVSSGPVSWGDPTYSFTMRWGDGSEVLAADASRTLVHQVALNALCGGMENPSDAWSPDDSNVPTAESDIDLTLTGEGESLPEVSVKYSAQQDGSLFFIFTADQYSVRLKMAASVSEGAVQKKTTSRDTGRSGEGTEASPLVITTTRTAVESKTSSIKWSFASLEVVGK